MENLNEEWRDVKDYEGYQVSNLGRVRSLDVYIKHNKGGLAHRHGIILKGFLSEKSDNYKGYRYSLYKNGKQRKWFIHILVAKAFPKICGEWFEGCDVHHIDFNPLNNNANNLIILSKQEHILIHRENGKNKGINNPFYGKHHTKETIQKAIKKKRKPIYQYSLDGECLCYWFSCTDCERETKMSKVSINRCCLGKQIQAYGYIWKYANEVG